jgi:two-component system, LuxR family, sensor histidine kinase TtrS
MLKRAIFLVALAGSLCLVASPSFSQEYKIGILSNRGADPTLKAWKPTAQYLSTKMKKSFSIVPLGDKQLALWTKGRKLDFVYTNPAMYAEFNKLYGVEAIATVVTKVNDYKTDQFGSVIIVKHDSPINSLADFKGKNFICRGRTAFGGWLMAKRLFIEKGVNPDKDFASLRDATTHDNVVNAVLYGKVDGGAVRTGTLETMAKAKKINLEKDFKIINRVSDDFPLIHSTQLYPEYPMAACAHVLPEVRTEVANALVAMLPSDPPAVAAAVNGWEKPLDYAPVIECLTMLKWGAFGK